MIDFGREPIDCLNSDVPRGQVFLIPERCKGCGICVQFCPLGLLYDSSTTNDKGYHLPKIKPEKEGSCVNCEFCSLVCPEFAIYTVEIVA